MQFKDCYNAAIAVKDYTLYLIKPLWIPLDFVLTKAFPLTLFPLKQFAWEEEPNKRGGGPNRRSVFASPQAREGTGLERTKFSFAPPNIPQLLQQELVEFEAQAYSDKIGSPNQLGKDGLRQIPQLPLSLLPQQELVEAEAETYRDKIGRGLNLLDLLGKRG